MSLRNFYLNCSGFLRATGCITSKKIPYFQRKSPEALGAYFPWLLGSPPFPVLTSCPLVSSLLFTLAASAGLIFLPLLSLLLTEQFTTNTPSHASLLSLQTQGQGREKGLEWIFFFMWCHNYIPYALVSVVPYWVTPPNLKTFPLIWKFSLFSPQTGICQQDLSSAKLGHRPCADGDLQWTAFGAGWPVAKTNHWL